MPTRRKSSKASKESTTTKVRSGAKKRTQKADRATGTKKRTGESATEKGTAAQVTTKKRSSKKVKPRAISPKGRPSGTMTGAALATTGLRFPGFDTGSYPGDNVMRVWFGNPYVFVGFYLDAPCHRDTTSGGNFRPWMGHLQTLKQIGWGLIIIYVGRQGTGCGSSQLTRERGLADARDAVNKATGEGIRRGALIYLDVEVVDNVAVNLLRYVRGWLAGILSDGRYEAGIYCHFRNANALFNAARQEYSDQGRPGDTPAFWIVRVPGGSAFNVATSSPQDLNNFSTTPISFASVWQGRINIGSETHAGVSFGPVDQDVADTNNPSNA